MDQQGRELFSPHVLEAGARRFGVDPSTLEALSGFDNIVYAGRAGNLEMVLRFTHAGHRSWASIDAELDWLLYLKECGASVCGPLRSIGGALVEAMPVRGDRFYVSVFERAPGVRVVLRDTEVNTTLYRHWGRATGELHRLSRAYNPPDHIDPRPAHLDSAKDHIDRTLEGHEDLKIYAHSLLEKAEELPRSESSYMLCHTDLHHGNFSYDGERLWIFDFDDCAYSHVAHDISMPLYYVTWRFKKGPEDLASFSRVFLTFFLAGYFEEFQIPLSDLLTVPLFLKIRDCLLLGVLIDEARSGYPTEFQALLPELRDRVISSRPVVEPDLASIYREALNMDDPNRVPENEQSLRKRS